MSNWLPAIPLECVGASQNINCFDQNQSIRASSVYRNYKQYKCLWHSSDLLSKDMILSRESTSCTFYFCLYSSEMWYAMILKYHK